MTSLPIYTAGLWQCCIDTIRHERQQAEGATIACHVCGESLCIRNGAWEGSAPTRATSVYNTRISEAAD